MPHFFRSIISKSVLFCLGNFYSISTLFWFLHFASSWKNQHAFLKYANDMTNIYHIAFSLLLVEHFNVSTTQSTLHLKLTVCNSLRSFLEHSWTPRGGKGAALQSSVSVALNQPPTASSFTTSRRFFFFLDFANTLPSVLVWLYQKAFLLHRWALAMVKCLPKDWICWPQSSSQSFEQYWTVQISVQRTRAEANLSQLCTANQERGWCTKGRLNVMWFSCCRFLVDRIGSWMWRQIKRY